MFTRGLQLITLLFIVSATTGEWADTHNTRQAVGWLNLFLAFSGGYCLYLGVHEAVARFVADFRKVRDESAARRLRR